MALCHDTMRDMAEEACDTTRNSTRGRTATQRCDTTGCALQHGLARLVTQTDLAYDTARPGLRHGVVRA